MKRQIYIILGIVVAIAILIGILYLVKSDKLRSKADVTSATLSINPSEKEMFAGNIYDIQIVLDTGERYIDGVDVRHLHYPSDMFQIDQVTIAPEFPNSSFTNNAGALEFSANVAGGSSGVIGANVLIATLKLRVINSNNLPNTLSFDFTPNNQNIQPSLSDTNAIEHGSNTDVLGAANGASYMIGGSATYKYIDFNLKLQGRGEVGATKQPDYRASKITLSVYDASGKQIYTRNDLATDASGHHGYWAGNIDVGQMYFEIKVPYYLKKKLTTPIDTFPQHIDVDFGQIQCGNFDNDPDEKVDSRDFTFLNANWGTDNGSAIFDSVDVNLDGRVDSADFTLMYSNWTG